MVFGCGSDNNPLASAREMVKDHPGANASITAANVDSVTAAVADVMASSFGRTFASALSAFFGSKPTREAQGGTITITLEEQVYAGLKSGSVIVRGGKLTVSSNGTTGKTTMEMNSALEYNDFSDDEIIFVGGTVEFNMSATVVSATEKIESLSGTYKAYLATSGKYEGAMETELTVSQDAAGVSTISGKVTTDGQTMTVNLTGMNLFGGAGSS
jgi:hypothetical protein